MAESFHRYTLSITKDLKARMDRCPEVNWSAIARRAFEKEVDAMESMQQNSKLNQKVLARLRQSKLDAEDNSYKLGLEAGSAWAEESAEFSELQRLGRAETDLEVMLERDDPAWSVSLVLFGDDAERDQILEFWKGETGDEYPSDSFVRGWVEGALKVFRAFEASE